MTTTVLRDGRVLHVPSFTRAASQEIVPPDEAELAALVPLIRSSELLLFTKRLVDHSRKRRHQDRWRETNAARLRMAQLCIDRALAELLA